MSSRQKSDGYDKIYEQFDSPLMQQLRQEAYGEDIGQYSWVTAQELAEDIPRLKLTPDSHLLDLGCGPGGPLTFIVGQVGCRGTGVDFSPEAVAAGKVRAASIGREEWIAVRQADLNQPLPFPAARFDAVISIDVVLHVEDRQALFREAARVLTKGGKFLFTDAAVLTGAISSEQVQRRAAHGHTQFVSPGFTERSLSLAGMRLLEQQDRTASLLKNAAGRIAARKAHFTELEKLEGSDGFEREQAYLETVMALSQSGTLSRMMYLAEVPSA